MAAGLAAAATAAAASGATTKQRQAVPRAAAEGLNSAYDRFPAAEAGLRAAGSVLSLVARGFLFCTPVKIFYPLSVFFLYFYPTVALFHVSLTLKKACSRVSDDFI